MLTELDDMLHHQVATTFDHVGTSDHRFFDRYWIGMYDPSGRTAFITGMGFYRNMNVADGFVTVQHAGLQHNLRLSRSLRPDVASQAVGPLKVEVEKPLQQLRITLEPGDYPVSCDLVWSGIIPPIEEKPHFTRQDGRARTDYHRFDQLGHAEGTLTIGDHTIEVADWFASRDHAWGVRPGVGGFEPTGRQKRLGGTGYLYTWFTFAVGELAGYVQVHEDGTGAKVLRDGVIRFVGGDKPDLEVVDGDLNIDFIPGTRQYTRTTIRFQTSDGQTFTATAEPLVPAFAMVGTGYDSGYDDGLGHGVWRGAMSQESDTYDISDPHRVVSVPSGEPVPHLHREQPVRVEIDGSHGTGHFTVVPIGEFTKYELPPYTEADWDRAFRLGA